MAFILKDRVLETSSTTGTGSFTLSGAVTGFVTFSSAIGNTNTTYYTIENPNTTEWEVGVGTVSAGTISRDTVLASSTGSKVNFTGGTKNVFCDYPATKSVYQDASGVVIVPSLVASTSLNATGTVSFNGLQGTAGQVLQSNGTGTTPTWVASPAAGAGGSNTQIQYNNSGVLAGNSTYTMVSGVMKENGYNFVSQADVGTNPSQVPLNQYLGTMAYEDKAGVVLTGDAKINGITAGLGAGQIATNTSYGASSLRVNTTGANNTSVGYQAGYTNSTGTTNLFSGYQAGYTNSTGSNNVILGGLAGTLASANYNVVIGGGAGASLTSGGSNTIIGPLAGANLTTGATNTYIGYTFASNANATNEMVIGYNAAGLGNNTTAIGNSSTTRTRVFGAIETTGYTVATLPTGVVGMRAYVTNALAPTYGSAVVGGGAVTIPVFYNGTTWIVA